MEKSKQLYNQVNFSHQDLQEHIFSNCTFIHCNFKRSNLRDTQFINCTFIEQGHWKGAIFLMLIFEMLHLKLSAFNVPF